MGDKIIGIRAVTEVSMTRKAMNRHCTKVLLKSKDAGGVTTDNQPEEESVMDAKTMKSFAGLQARIGATAMNYVAQMEDDKIKSFFEQDAEAQDAEVKAWDEAEKAKAAEAEAKEKAKSAGDPKVVALEAQVEQLQETVKSLSGAAGDAALVEKAKAYPHIPQAQVIKTLKSIAGLSADDQAPVLETLKARNDMAGQLTTRQIVDPSTIEGSAAQVLKSKVKAYAAEKNVDENQAMLAVTALPENAELIQQVRDEEETAQAA